MVKRTFRFNKASRKSALETLKLLGSSSLITGLIGAAATSAVVASLLSLLVFLICRGLIVLISGIEDVEEESDKPAPARAKKASAARRRCAPAGDGRDAA